MDRDPFDPSVDFRDVKVLMTMIRGVVEHDTLGSHESAAAGYLQ
jgi:hypothetical protein